ncbi:MAG: hypothetical protein ABR562_09535, partial [Thermoplasmatota archaeon]
IVAQHAAGPLWVVLGDSTSQGIGATTREAGYVGVVHEVLRRRDVWRMINLSRAGVGVADVLEALVHRLPAPEGDAAAPLKALLVDSWYDPYLGVVILVRVKDGALTVGQKIRLMATGASHNVERVGVFTPKGVNSCMNGSCSFSTYCAYHGHFASGGTDVLYASMPYAGTDLNGCGAPTSPNGDADADAEISIISHEHFETVTDPD